VVSASALSLDIVRSGGAGGTAVLLPEARSYTAPGELRLWPFLAKTAQTAKTQKAANARRLSDDMGDIGIQCYRPKE
jgi:hypothetical protein